MKIRPVNRLVMVGLGGASLTWLKSWFDRGLLPNLSAIWGQSASGTLLASQPSASASSWASILTGHPVSSHGVYDHDWVQSRHHGHRPSDHRSLWVPHLWQILSDQGHSVVSLQVPLTYSMNNVNGLVVGGSDSPSSRSVWHGSPELLKRIRNDVPDWSHKSIWKKRPASTEELLATLHAFERRLTDLGRLISSADSAIDWSVFCVHLQDIDALQHRLWPELELDSSSTGIRPEWVLPLQKSLRKLDDLIGQIAELADRHQAGLMVLSEHGFGPCQALVNVNGILRVHGIQRGQGLGGRVWQSGSRLVDRGYRWVYESLPNSGLRHRPRPMHLNASCDRSRSLAYAPFGRLAGLVYLTEKARRQESRTERVTQEIAEILRLIADPDTGQSIFSSVIPVASRWNIDPVKTCWPDIIAMPANGYHPVARWDHHDKVRLLAYDPNLPGTHRMEGVLAMTRSGLPTEPTLRAHVQDIAPTVLKWLGLTAPEEAPGVVISTSVDVSPYHPHIRPGSSRVVIESASKPQVSCNPYLS